MKNYLFWISIEVEQKLIEEEVEASSLDIALKILKTRHSMFRMVSFRKEQKDFVY